MKQLFLGLAPLVVFWLFEDKFGTFWGIIASIVFAFFECGYEYVKTKKIQKLTLFSTGLIVVLGFAGILLDKSVLFKFQPVILQLSFVLVLIWGGRGGEPLLMKMARAQKPEVFQNQSSDAYTFQLGFMKRMTRNLIVILVILSVLLAIVAVRGTTAQWVFWKGIGINIFLCFWIGAEALMLRRKEILSYLRLRLRR